MDNLLCDTYPWGELKGIRRFIVEFLYFGIKEARACLFAGLFFISIFVVPHGGLFGIPRYDVLLIIALGIQFFMIWSRLETLDEAKAILLFHIVGFALEVFKTSSAIQSWSYPDFAYSKVLGVPLFPVSCTPPSAATSSRRGACWMCAFAIIPPIGWQR
ncbi:putative protein yoaT [Agrobacterium tumefaciens]|nr:putative protein yoaT [Agrobacterium tumefaciens]